MKARICLAKIVISIGFLVKQGTAFRGHDSDSGNFFELIDLHCEDSLECLDVSEICTEICSQNPPIFSIICDGTRDISGEEQLSACFRWVNKDLCPRKSFVGLYSVGKTTLEHLISVLLDVMIRHQ
ncbi:hypothetical protein PR048_011803 [Dryococelus australis]|uniref:DUF4371 domain-containing protein n=1 Tax=Dryococelus australis TaxID=614101 RepID=A0ABQ9HMT5_9NEOP|nr:hypothetical protein PR048_011803 [Dryococelus australis]